MDRHATVELRGFAGWHDPAQRMAGERFRRLVSLPPSSAILCCRH